MRKRSKDSRRSGVAAIEFAFVAPIFLLFVFGLFEMVRMLMVQQALTNAAREGCRTAVMATTVNNSDVDTAIRDYLQSITSHASDTSIVRVTSPSGLATCPSGTALTVAVEVNYSDVSWPSASYLGLNPTLHAQQTGRRE